VTKTETKHLNSLIKAGKTTEAAQFLLSLDAPKKRGRPKKVVEPEILEEVKPLALPKKELPPNTVSTKGNKTSEANRVVGTDGKEHTKSREVGWSPPEKIVFADYGVAKQKLNYPEPTQRRPPAQTIRQICKGCRKEFDVYPSQINGVTGTDDGVTFKCNRCAATGS
jgi:hypothetical protein